MIGERRRGRSYNSESELTARVKLVDDSGGGGEGGGGN